MPSQSLPDIAINPPLLAVIREDECIGCMKCVQACPVDSIIGASKFMHTVMTDVCIGCGLCVPPCPVDCIDMIALPERTPVDQKKLESQSKIRFENKNIRLEKERVKERAGYLQSKQSQLKNKTVDERKAEIAEIIQRAQKRGR
ncbi:MAG: RnfABCDGE type electron transport complex subunit B [Gammaproteobacteria bacterium]|nr:RnfABCDGE type electron transport complex subunit B [Gammaproteobacteria bacterium]